MSENRRKKDSAKLVWDTKPKRAPNPRDIEFQTAEIVIPNPQEAQGNLPLLAVPQSGLTSLFPGQMGELPLGGFDIDKTKMNRLIWGDNLLAMQALLAQGYAGKIDLIYIDPPFLSSADYSFQLSIEGKQVDKEPNIIERLAYTDTWEGGMDSFLDMMYPRLQLIKRLLSNQGSIYIHLDWNVCHYIKILLDEIFGKENCLNEVIWQRATAKSNINKKFPAIHETIFIYTVNEDFIFNKQYTKYTQEYLDKYYCYIESPDKKYTRRLQPDESIPKGWRRFASDNLVNPGIRPNLRYSYKGYPAPSNGWKISIEEMERLDHEDRLIFPDKQDGRIRLKRYADEMPGRLVQDIWNDSEVAQITPGEHIGYPTQKPEGLTGGQAS